jgi:rod shape-determining protein MreD
MKGVLTFIGCILGPLWLFQGRANLVDLCGTWPYIPDLLLLGLALVACRADSFAAVLFAMASGFLADVCVDQAFGFHASINTLLVALFITTKRVFYYESKISLVLAVFSLTLIQKIVIGFYLVPSSQSAYWLPRIAIVSVMTALAALLFHPLIDLFLQPTEREDRERRAFR